MELRKYNDFDVQVDEFYNQLKTNYLSQIELAKDKEYAKAFFYSQYFERNVNVPKDSFFFDTLTKLLVHHYRLNPEMAIFNTLDQLHLARERAEFVLNTAFDVYDVDSRSEPMSFMQEEVLEKELYLLELDIPELVNLLAIYLATKRLMAEFPKNETVELFSLEAPLLTDKTSFKSNAKVSARFTESQQVLAIHFLFESLGIQARRDYSLSAYARFTHLIARREITVIENSPKHSMIKRLLNFKDEKHPSLKDLKAILPYFKDMRLDGIVANINKEIKFKEDENKKK